MREQPTAVELLDIVAEFLRAEVLPALSGRTAFHTRVAANVLDMVRREVALGPGALVGEAERLRSLLGSDGDVADLNHELCERIAGGDVDLFDADLLDHLWKTTIDTVAIDQPKYATYRRATAGEPGDA
ncbi:DUF6285 domain-containing protein [uncultured Phenylobacterium sp.]|uniref:DUF6285 domain-containing protein n=1 Tax=uncultured Phenylobacterium sp. TaxID=349273 RepID=UPI0025DC54F5|nr:DUF6285 domain-containing protein [uncultured Phenylobacterium sp.]